MTIDKIIKLIEEYGAQSYKAGSCVDMGQDRDTEKLLDNIKEMIRQGETYVTRTRLFTYFRSDLGEKGKIT